MPARKPSPVGAHVPLAGATRYAEQVGAEAVQVHSGNPRAWRPPVADLRADATFADWASSRRIPVFVHVPYLVNLASPSDLTRARSVTAVRDAVRRAARLGARGVIVHAGSAVQPGTRAAGYRRLRESLLPVLDDLGSPGPDILVEPTAGGGEPLAATVSDLAAWLEAVDAHPRVGVCLDTCHLFAAGHDLASPGGLRVTLNEYLRVVGRRRLGLVHANDSRDECGARRDRHANIGDGRIGAEAFGELFRHPATHGVPIVVETPAESGGQARDIDLLKSLRNRG